jgi:DNA-dependent RNA polymerase auxiliary subunit epsilon
VKKLPSLHSKPPKQRKEVDYYTPKKAFDQVLEHYPAEAHVDLFGSETARAAGRARIKADLKIVYDFYDAPPVKNKKGKAQGVVAAKGTPVKNPTAPSMTDFKIDVEKQVRKVIKTHEHVVEFIKRYIFDMEVLSKEQQHLFADFEQRIGRLFIQAKIYPLGKYLISIRKDKVSQ